MANRPFPFVGKTIYGANGTPYQLVSYAYNISDEYRLPVFSGINTRNNSKITVIAFDIKDQSKLETCLSLYKTKSDLNLIDIARRDEVDFVIFNLLSSEFENVYLNLPVEKPLSHHTEKSSSDELLSKVSNGINHDPIVQAPIRKRPQYQIVFLFAFLCGVVFSGGLFLGRYFAVTPVEVSKTHDITQNTPLPLITPPTTDIVIPIELNTLTPERTFTPSPTDTSIHTNTPITTGTQLTLTLGATPTITSVPFREGLPGEIKLRVIKKGNIRSVPSIASDNTILGKLEVEQSFWFKAQLKDGNRIWLQIGPDQWISWIDNSGQRRSLHLNDGWVSYIDLLEKNDDLVFTLPVVTSSPTPTITPNP